MTFKKAFHIGYLIFLVLLAGVYYLVPHEYSWIAILILSLLFGLYQIVSGYVLKRKKLE
ncbi:hypothetical protein M3182_14860 [Mesobacillus maritimus]|nr:hypothetical protein [Mesobacillus maritimus]MCM3587016.1 hypothetical protein [Mesobacillus maritimus]